MEVQINNRQRLVKISKDIVKRIVEAVIKSELKQKFNDNLEISINFVRDKKIREINKKYLFKNSPTDVISFSMREGKFQNINPQLLGDVFISTETARKQAKIYKNSVNQELILYLIHGVLHILKYDDIKPEKRKLMKKKENYFWRKFKKSDINLIAL